MITKKDWEIIEKWLQDAEFIYLEKPDINKLKVELRKYENTKGKKT